MRYAFVLPLLALPAFAAETTTENYERFGGATCRGEWLNTNKQGGQELTIEFGEAEDGKHESAYIALDRGTNRIDFGSACFRPFPATTSVTSGGLLRIDIDWYRYACGPTWFAVRADGNRLIQPSGFITLTCDMK